MPPRKTTGSKPAQLKFVEPYSLTEAGNRFGLNSETVHVDPFIINTPSSTTTDPRVRRYIRSHVMRGKNTKAGRKKHQQDQGPPHEHEATLTQPGSLGHKPGTEHFAVRHSSLGRNASASPITSSAKRQISYAQWIPQPFGNQAFIQFAEPLPPSKISLLLKFCDHIKHNLYPLNMCVDVGSFNPDVFMGYLSVDRAFLQCCIFAAKAMSELIEGGKNTFGREATLHLNKTLRLLQSNLSDKAVATTDYNIAIVLILILMSCSVGDMSEVAQHISGVKRMIKLRGGINSLASNPMLQIKACRADLSFSHAQGIRPAFYSDDEIEGFWNRPSIAASIRASNHENPRLRAIRKHNDKTREQKGPVMIVGGAAIVPALGDSLLSDQQLPPSLANHIGRLTAVFDDLHEFCQASNMALRTGDKVNAMLFKDVLISTQYRLAKLHYPPTEVTDTDTPLEISLIRVGMLLFTTITFLRMEAMIFRHPSLSETMRELIVSISAALPHIIIGQQQRNATAMLRLRVMLWFLFVAHASTFSVAAEEDLLVRLVSDILIALGLKSRPPREATTAAPRLFPGLAESGELNAMPLGGERYAPPPRSDALPADLAEGSEGLVPSTGSCVRDCLLRGCLNAWVDQELGVLDEGGEPVASGGGATEGRETSSMSLLHSDDGVGGFSTATTGGGMNPVAKAAVAAAKDELPLAEVWEILRDHMWIDWVHRENGKVLVSKAFWR